MEAIETFEHAGYTVKLYMDEEPSSPADWDNLGTLVAFPHLDYTFPERQSTGTEDEAMERGGFKLLARYLRMTEGAYVVPFHFSDYGSGGARLYAGTTENIGLLASGFIVTTPDRVRELCGDDPKFLDPAWVEDALRGELEVWGQYVEGDVYGYVVESPGEDSLWGLYGLDYAREEARRAAEDERDYEEREAVKVARAVAL